MTTPTVVLALLATAALTASAPTGIRLVPARRRRRVPSRLVAAAIPAAVILYAAGVSVALAIAAVLLGAMGAGRYSRRRRAAGRQQESRLIVAALEVLVGELRAGAHPVAAFTVAAAESDGPVATTLLSVASRARYGADVSAGLWEATRLSSAPDSWERIAVYWKLAAEHGLAMATLMGAARNDILSRQRFSETVHAGLAGARATAAILAAMPVIGVLLGCLIGAHPVSFLLAGRPGAVLMTIGVALICAGVIWSDRIIDRVVR